MVLLMGLLIITMMTLITAKTRKSSGSHSLLYCLRAAAKLARNPKYLSTTTLLQPMSQLSHCWGGKICFREKDHTGGFEGGLVFHTIIPYFSTFIKIIRNWLKIKIEQKWPSVLSKADSVPPKPFILYSRSGEKTPIMILSLALWRSSYVFPELREGRLSWTQWIFFFSEHSGHD